MGKTDLARHREMVSNGDLRESLEKTTICGSASLATLPAEVMLGILGNLKKKHWFSLSRTCKGISGLVVAELDKYNAEEGDHYATWYACVNGNHAMLLRQIAHDASIVNRYFTSDFQHAKATFPYGRDLTPLAVSIMAGQGSIVQLLLTKGADANVPDQRPVLQNGGLWYPINWAVASKHEASVSIIEMLRDHSADMNQIPQAYADGDFRRRSGEKCPPIFHLLALDKPSLRLSRHPTICEEFNQDFLKLQDFRRRQLVALLQGGADPSTIYYSQTPVSFLLGSLEAYTPSFYFSNQLMLSHEEDAQAEMVNDIIVSFLATLHSFGADMGTLSNVELQQDQLARKKSGPFVDTPLHMACRLNDRHRPIIYWFLRNGAPITCLGKAKSTPLMAYCGSVFIDTEQFRDFLDLPHAINYLNSRGLTALHRLCYNVQIRPQVMEKAVQMMLDRGADPTIIGAGSLSVTQQMGLQYDSSSVYWDVVKMLIEASKEWEKRKVAKENRKQSSTAHSATHHQLAGKQNNGRKRGGRGGNTSQMKESHRPCTQNNENDGSHRDHGGSKESQGTDSQQQQVQPTTRGGPPTNRGQIQSNNRGRFRGRRNNTSRGDQNRGLQDDRNRNHSDGTTRGQRQAANRRGRSSRARPTGGHQGLGESGNTGHSGYNLRSLDQHQVENRENPAKND